MTRRIIDGSNTMEHGVLLVIYIVGVALSATFYVLSGLGYKRKKTCGFMLIVNSWMFGLVWPVIVTTAIMAGIALYIHKLIHDVLDRPIE